MKILLFLIFIGYTSLAYAQTPRLTVVAGDNIELSLSGCDGDSIQWQESLDHIVWSDMIGFNSNYATFSATSSPTGKKYYRAKCMMSFCPNAEPGISSVITYKVIDSISQVSIGDFIRGGVIFQLDSFGNGLISALNDQSTGEEWGCYNLNFSGAYDTINGKQNTLDLLNNCSVRPIAASICDDFGYLGYSDWYLPSKTELNELYLKQTIVNNFEYDFYWTSTNFDSTKAWLRHFLDGSQIKWVRNSNNHVRCIRVFSEVDTLKRMVSHAQISNYIHPVPLSIYTQPQSLNKCKGETFSLHVYASGDWPHTYQWKKNGIVIPGQNFASLEFINATSSDEGFYSYDVTNHCGTISSHNAELKIVEISADAGEDKYICKNQTSLLSAQGQSNYPSISCGFSYFWSPALSLNDNVIQNPIASPDSTTTYIVRVNDTIGCYDTDTVVVNVAYPDNNPQICYVSFDTLSGKNKIFWEPSQENDLIKYSLFRNVAGHIYEQITETNSLTTIYIDTIADPNLSSYSYKITATDTCQQESSKSMYHKSIYLSPVDISSTVNIEWNHYEIENNVFQPDEYEILGGNNPNNLHWIATVPGNATTYSDANVYSLKYYMIKALSDCKEYSIFSNICSNGLEGINYLTNYYNINISPNPMRTSTILSIPNFSNQLSVISNQLTITDVTGKVVRVITVGEAVNLQIKSSSNLQIEIIRGDLKSGIYFLELFTDRLYRSKLVVE